MKLRAVEKPGPVSYKIKRYKRPFDIIKPTFLISINWVDGETL